MSERIFPITEGQVKHLIQVSSYCHPDIEVTRRLRDWFPEAFKPEWEEIPLGGCTIRHILGDPWICDSEGNGLWRVELSPGPRHYKIEDGKIWRRKA